MSRKHLHEFRKYVRKELGMDEQNGIVFIFLRESGDLHVELDIAKEDVEAEVMLFLDILEHQ